MTIKQITKALYDSLDHTGSRTAEIELNSAQRMGKKQKMANYSVTTASQHASNEIESIKISA